MLITVLLPNYVEFFNTHEFLCKLLFGNLQTANSQTLISSRSKNSTKLSADTLTCQICEEEIPVLTYCTRAILDFHFLIILLITFRTELNALIVINLLFILARR